MEDVNHDIVLPWCIGYQNWLYWFTRLPCTVVDERDLKEVGDKLKQHQRDAARRENTLVHRLTTKEQELQDYIVSTQKIRNTYCSSLNENGIIYIWSLVRRTLIMPRYSNARDFFFEIPNIYSRSVLPSISWYYQIPKSFKSPRLPMNLRWWGFTVHIS
jgi:hypothetical protein